MYKKNFTWFWLLGSKEKQGMNLPSELPLFLNFIIYATIIKSGLIFFFFWLITDYYWILIILKNKTQRTGDIWHIYK